tara:strand:+ start:47181 stop:47363 length:183 start_codon:yes stop_codon:yes gene_type:complete
MDSDKNLSELAMRALEMMVQSGSCNHIELDCGAEELESAIEELKLAHFLDVNCGPFGSIH